MGKEIPFEQPAMEAGANKLHGLARAVLNAKGPRTYAHARKLVNGLVEKAETLVVTKTSSDKVRRAAELVLSEAAKRLVRPKRGRVRGSKWAELHSLRTDPARAGELAMGETLALSFLMPLLHDDVDDRLDRAEEACGHDNPAFAESGEQRVEIWTTRQECIINFETTSSWPSAFEAAAHTVWQDFAEVLSECGDVLE